MYQYSICKNCIHLKGLICSSFKEPVDYRINECSDYFEKSARYFKKRKKRANKTML